jgi:hypothetical protein
LTVTPAAATSCTMRSAPANSCRSKGQQCNGKWQC